MNYTAIGSKLEEELKRTPLANTIKFFDNITIIYSSDNSNNIHQIIIKSDVDYIIKNIDEELIIYANGKYASWHMKRPYSYGLWSICRTIDVKLELKLEARLLNLDSIQLIS